MKHIRRYRLNSIFIKILLILMGMAALMFFVVYGLFYRVVGGNLRQRADMEAMNTLVATSGSVDHSLQSVGRLTYQLFWQTNIVGLVLNPEMADYSRKEEAIKGIADIVRNNDLITDAYLVVDRDRSVYCANGGILEGEGFTYAALYQRFRDGTLDEATTLDGEGYRSFLVQSEGALLLMQAFPTPERNGALLVVLDTDRLFGILRKLASDSVALEIEDGRGKFLYPVPRSVLALPADGVVNTYTSRLTGWVYRHVAEPPPLHLRSDEVMSGIAPLLLFFVGVSVVAALYVSNAIYRPVGKLFQAVIGETGTPPTAPDAENELDFVRLSYESAVQESGEMSRRVAAILPDLREKLYKSLLFGRDNLPEALEEQLRACQSPFGVDDRFQIVLVSPGRRENQYSELEANLFGISVDNFARGVGEGPRYDSVLLDDGRLVMVLALPADTAEATLQQALHDSLERLSDFCRSLPYLAVIGVGGVWCRGARNLSVLYRDALQSWRRQLYLAGDDAEPDMTPDDDRFQEPFASIGQLALEGDQKAALDRLVAVAEEIRATVESVAEREGLLRALLHALQEKLVELQIDSAEWPPPTEPGDWDACLQAARQNLLLLCKYGNKARFRYVEKAKAYIRECFGDSALSLQAVADYVGITPTYLSRLFYEVGELRFVDYLSQCRVDYAKQLLAGTGITVQDVGYKAGFNSPQSFNRVFKRCTGTTPSEYRRQAKGGTGG